MENSKPSAKNFQDLIVWQKAHQLVLKIYRLTKAFPKEECFGIVSQVRRSAVSVPANIAEGFKKVSKPEKAHYINMAQCSLEETKYYLILSKELGYAYHLDIEMLVEEVARLLNRYRAKILEK